MAVIVAEKKVVKMNTSLYNILVELLLKSHCESLTLARSVIYSCRKFFLSKQFWRTDEITSRMKQKNTMKGLENE